MIDQIDLKHTLIFIPDISGFTEFINKVEVAHSTHIIQELIEIIIDSNVINLKVSEIEGDAVLFYRIGSEPSAEEIAMQAETMYLEFHRHLKLYERHRICQCGACSTTDRLTLKFVSHFGRVVQKSIKNHEKLFGPDVTLAHRLLKNNISEDEYVLLSSSPQNSNLSKAHDWVKLKNGKDSYDGIGEVLYKYFSLSALQSRISEIPINLTLEKYRNPVSVSQVINASLETVHGVVTDVCMKPKWILGLKSVREESSKLSRIGAKHLCIMPAMSIEFEITSQKIKDGLINYVEKTESFKWLSPLSFFYTMKHISVNKMRITLNIHYKQNILSKLHLDFPLRMMMAVNMKLSLRKLRKYIASLPN